MTCAGMPSKHIGPAATGRWERKPHLIQHVSPAFSRRLLRLYGNLEYICRMRAVIQRVSEASVSIGGHVKSAIGKGYVVLVGICADDDQSDAEWLVKKITNLRVFNDDNGVMNRSIMETGGDILVISQFTLFASYKKGNRPSWLRAANHAVAIPLYNDFCAKLSASIGRQVGTGEFGADMQVSLINDGPVTICMDTKNKE